MNKFFMIILVLFAVNPNNNGIAQLDNPELYDIGGEF
ncbi:uncharacterized protein METZ01_LOCUS243099, partial [marine metagenome]